MAYFLLLPAFALWLVVAALFVVITYTVSRLKRMHPYAWRVALWATVGFLAANIALASAVAVGFVAIEGSSSGPYPTAIRDTAQITLGIATIIGPFVASALGWLAGAIFGLALARRSRRHAY